MYVFSISPPDCYSCILVRGRYYCVVTLDLLSCLLRLLFQNAESVEVDSIPLPDMPHAPYNIHIQDIPLPGAQPPSILKKSTAFG